MSRFLLPALLLFAASPAVAAGPYDNLLKFVPPTANTMVLIDPDALFKSEVGRSQRWAERFAQRFRAGITSISPESKKIVVAGSTNARTFDRQWQVALAEMRQVPNAREIAARTHGSVDEVGGRFAALSPQQVYFVTVSEEVTATWHPANRQLLSHWLRHVKAAPTRKELLIAPYLQDVAKKDGAAAFVAALDLTDAFEFAGVRAWLEDSRTLVTRPDVAKDPVAKMIARMRGLTFSLNVTDKLTATLRADFDLDAATHKTVLKELFLEAVQDEGLSLGDLEWETSFQGKSMLLTCELKPEMMPRILSLFEFPQADGGRSLATAGDAPSADATRSYFKAVVACVEEVKAMQENKDYEKTATWHESYARKVGRMSTRGVDPAAAKFGQGVADRLRAIAGSMRGVPIDAKAVAAGGYALATASGNGRGWGWRGRGASYSLDTNLPQTRAAVAKVIAEDAKNRMQIWGEIAAAAAETKHQLSAQYGGGF